MIYIAGITITVFLLLLLGLKRNKSRADRILGVWLIVMCVHQMLFYLDYTGISYRYPNLLGLAMPLPILHGILLYFYVSAITRQGQIHSWKALMHFSPFVLLIVLALPFYLLPGAEKIRVYENHGKGYEWYNMFKITLIVTVGLFYTAWSLVLIHRYRSRLQQLLSNTDRKNLHWLEYLSIGLGAIWLLAAFFDDRVIFTAVVVLVLFIGYFGINQLPIFYSGHVTTQEKEPVASPGPESASPPRYEKSGLKDEEADRIYRELQDIMSSEALYKQNDLTLSELAGRLGVHPNYLSQVINQKEKKSFYHYINTLRVQEFIRKASQADSERFTLLALAYDCGFNSKSTFNKYFKHNTGKTPTEYFGNVQA